MRSSKRRRPLIRAVTEPPKGINLTELAKRAKYVGSPEHKSAPSFAGSPRLRSTATKCDPRFNHRQDELTEWLRESIRQGKLGALWEGSFPRYVWYRDGETVYEARLVNREQGTYKGYQLNEDQWPQGITNE